MLASPEVIQQLEFDKILEAVAKYAIGSPAKHQILKIRKGYHHDELKSELSRVSEISLMKEEGDLLRLNPYEDIKNDLFMLKKGGYILEATELIRIMNVLINYDLFINHFTKSRIKNYNRVYKHIYFDEFDSRVLKTILKVFDQEGNVRENASPELIAINKKINSLKTQINKTFDHLILRFRKQHILSDNIESIRSGRRVLVLPVEHKRKIEGVIHDQSASGKTVYIEPQELTHLNNELYSAENDRLAVIFQILKSLSEDLRNDHFILSKCFEQVIKLDILIAKGIFSSLIEGVMPILSEKPLLQLINAFHPLLYFQEKANGPKTISFDLELKGQNRLLLISGPNAGGKTVTLKAVGLFHLMIYHGLLLPIDEKSKIGQFRRIHCDIGDQQSIDKGLSTYSSHLDNLNKLLEHADSETLILLDEIGSGTDPKLGGAIAEGIIKELLNKKSSGVITTHYSELKVFAFRNPGIVNGAMLFDKENLRPSYKLKVGKPGSSYAFEVAKKIGLPESVIKYAKRKVGKKEHQIEDLLIDLQESKAILDEQLNYLEKEKIHLDKLVKNYEGLKDELEVKRKKLQIRNKELAFKKANEESVELQHLITKLEKEKSLEKARKIKQEALQKRNQESQEIKSLKKDVYANRNKDEVIQVGDFVKLIDGESSGKVMELKDDKAKVLFGILPMEVRVEELVKSRDQIEINASKKINVRSVDFDSNFNSKLDIRGYKLSDAEDTLDEFFDKAILNNARLLEVIHGKGKGALRKLVISKIKQFESFHSYYHPSEEQGGDGVTLIKL